MSKGRTDHITGKNDSCLHPGFIKNIPEQRRVELKIRWWNVYAQEVYKVFFLKLEKGDPDGEK